MTEIQLATVRTFGSKELSEGCLFSWNEYTNHDLLEEIEIQTFHHKTDSLLSQSEYCIATDWHEYCIYEILWHIPELFPDVARELSKEWYVLELLKVDTIKSVLKISRFDIKKDIIISYKKLIPLIDQDSQLTLIPLLSLIK